MFYGTVTNFTSRITKQVACYALNTQNNVSLKMQNSKENYQVICTSTQESIKNIHLHTMSLLSTVSRNSMQWLVTGIRGLTA